MKIVDKREKTIVEETDIGITCDECKKVIRSEIEMHRRDSANPYYEVNTYHHDWGNDSYESNRYFDFWCFECLMSHMKRYCEKANGTESYVIERSF